jgi:hypothetical protein
VLAWPLGPSPDPLAEVPDQTSYDVVVAAADGAVAAVSLARSGRAGAVVLVGAYGGLALTEAELGDEDFPGLPAYMDELGAAVGARDVEAIVRLLVAETVPKVGAEHAPLVEAMARPHVVSMLAGRPQDAPPTIHPWVEWLGEVRVPVVVVGEVRGSDALARRSADGRRVPMALPEPAYAGLTHPDELARLVEELVAR